METCKCSAIGLDLAGERNQWSSQERRWCRLESPSIRLANLRVRVIKELLVERWHEVWFFPPMESVMGWQGTGPISFVGPNPSAGRFPSWADRGFYDHLRANGLPESHLTDAIKIRTVEREVKALFADSEVVNISRGYLGEEFKILSPRLVVALGWLVYRVLLDWFPTPPFELVRITHYSCAYRYGKVGIFAKELADIASRAGPGT